MPAGRLAVGLATAAVCTELCVSANLLTWAGVPYVSEGGALPLKLHPGTDLLIVAAGIALIRARPAVLLAGQALLAVFFAAMASCVLSILVLSGPSNLIVILDTFLPAGLLALVLCGAPDAAISRLRGAMQSLLAANALLALVETAEQATLIPLYLNDSAYHPHGEDFRPTALFDHPLTGAVMTMLGLSLPPRGPRLRIAYLCLMGAALVAFGGRMALGVTVLSAVLLAAGNFAGQVLRRDRRAAWTLLAAGGAAAAGVVVLGLALSAGLGDRLAGHLYWDSSAQTRLAQWQILAQLDVPQLLFGTPRDQLLSQLNTLRLNTGVEVVENFWLLMFVSLGAAGFPLFLAGFGALCLWCWRRTTLQGRALLVGVIIVASSSNSLGRKSTVLVCLVAALVCMPRQRSMAPRAAPAMRLAGLLPA